MAIAVVAVPAGAAVNIDELDNGRMELRMDNASNGDALKALGEHMALEIRVSDHKWAAQRTTDSFAGTPERVLENFLDARNFVFSYWGDGSIAGVTVLGEGQEQVLYTPEDKAAHKVQTVQVGPAGAESSHVVRARPDSSSQAVTGRSVSRSTAGGSGATRSADQTARGDAASNSSNVSNMLAARARQGTNQANSSGANDAAPVGDPHAETSPTNLSPENAEALRRLTQQAQRDVQALVEALKQAEQDSSQR